MKKLLLGLLFALFIITTSCDDDSVNSGGNPNIHLLKEYIYERNDISLGRITYIKWDYNNSNEVNEIYIEFTTYSDDRNDTTKYNYTVDNIEYSNGYPISADTYNSLYDKHGTIKSILDNNTYSIESSVGIMWGLNIGIDIQLTDSTPIKYSSEYYVDSTVNGYYNYEVEFVSINDSINKRIFTYNVRDTYSLYDVIENDINYPSSLSSMILPELIGSLGSLYFDGRKAISVNSSDSIFPNNEHYNTYYNYILDDKGRIINVEINDWLTDTYNKYATLKYLHE